MSAERRGRRGTRPAGPLAEAAEHVRRALTGATLGLVLGVVVGGVVFVVVRAVAGEAAGLRVLGAVLLAPTLLLGARQLRESLRDGAERPPPDAPRFGLAGRTARMGLEAGQDVGVAIVAPAALGYALALLIGAPDGLDDALGRIVGALALGALVGIVPGLALGLDRVRRRWTGPRDAPGTLLVLALLPALVPFGLLVLLGDELGFPGASTT